MPDEKMSLHKELADPKTHDKAAKEASGTYPGSSKSDVKMKKGGKVKKSKK